MPHHTRKILEFLEHIGLVIELCEFSQDSFLPGIKVTRGVMLVDLKRLEYPGDLLHEAGHLALLSQTERENWSGDFTDAGGYELGAIAWSYAASIHLRLAPDIVFHQNGYKGDAAWLAEQYTAETYIGLPMLEWRGMASSKGNHAYPEMRCWLCMQE